jgi:alpha-1,3-glucan synthase
LANTPSPVFNLLHAGASYLRIHQQGFGAVGVSKKYGARSFARYPIFWGLSKVGQLPNPDPTDTAEWHKDELMKSDKVAIDAEFEAGLEQRADAELFVFVGRWSLQKGVSPRYVLLRCRCTAGILEILT